VRIISPDFHDYYDDVQSLGQDCGLVYVRRRAKIEGAESLAAYPEPVSPEIQEEEWDGGRNTNRIYGRAFWLAVAGAVYRGYRLVQTGVYPFHKDRTEYVYSPAELASALAAWGVVAPSDFRGHARWRAKDVQRRERSRNAWLNAQGTLELRERLAECGVVVAVRLLGDRFRDGLWVPRPLVLNPRLADFAFGRVLPAQTVYQEIAMWIGGVLPQRGAMTATVPDPIRFEEHGFDSRTSFRRTKTP